VEHSGYDALDIRGQRKTIADDVINTVTTNDPFLNKLCGDSADFINLVDEPVNANVETVEEDTENIDHVFNVKEGINYDEERLKEQLAEQDCERKMDYYHPSNWTQKEESFEVEPYNKNLTTVDANVQTQESVAANISDKGEIGFRLGDFEAEDNYKSNADLEIPNEEPIATVTPSA
ncbi:hypothetical protein Tco_0181335, partial [Tanacetum coccineum]